MLDSRIVEKLSKALKGKRTVGTIKKDISLLRREYPGCTPNARAQIYAQMNGTSVWQLLSKEDRATLPSKMSFAPANVYVPKIKQKIVRERIRHFVSYITKDHFRLAHIEEVNRAYSFKCYTAVFILCRKIMENIVADILRAKFPPTTRENKELYFDTSRGRNRDFQELLNHLNSKKAAFEMEKKLVERILTKVMPFKDEADQKVHSWYHIVKTKKEIDDMDAQGIFDLLYALEQKIPTSTA